MENKNTQTINYRAYTKKIENRQLFEFIIQKQDFKLSLIIIGSLSGLFSLAIIISHGLVSYLVSLFPYIVLGLSAYIWYQVYTARKEIKYNLFAKDNDFKYESTISGYKDNGLIFNQDKGGTITDRYSGIYKGLKFWIGTYSSQTGYPNNNDNIITKVICVKLPKELPNVFIDSKKNNFMGRNWIGPAYSKKQEFDLEGNFNNYYSIYSPKNYERDALYFLTPELMALLVDHGQGYDIEVINNELKLYMINSAFTYNKDELTQTFRLIDVIGGEFTDNVGLYKGEKLAAVNMVDPRVRQLEKGIEQLKLVRVILIIISLLTFIGATVSMFVNIS